MAPERGRYRTRQQEEILSLLKAHRGTFKTVEQVSDELRQQGVSVGRTTVYRSLDRFVKDGLVSEIPPNAANPARYAFLEGETGAKLVCTKCHDVSLIDCDGLESFVEHIEEDHRFSVDPGQTVIYGLCDTCEHEQTS